MKIKRNYDLIAEFVFWLTILLIFVLHGCTKTIYVPIKSETKITEVVRDTIVKVKLEQSEKTVQISERDTISLLENKYSYSKWERVGGNNYHYLWTKGDVDINVSAHNKIITRTDSIPYPVPGEKIIIENTPKWIVYSFIISMITSVVFIFLFFKSRC